MPAPRAAPAIACSTTWRSPPRRCSTRAGSRRVLVVDCDVHQGDGTARIFAGRREVLTLSLHAERNYPARKAASTLDYPLPDRLGDRAYLEVLGARARRRRGLRAPTSSSTMPASTRTPTTGSAGWR